MKYQGNKNRIVKDILPIIMSYRKPGQWYVEPFCGSCSVLQHVPEPRSEYEMPEDRFECIWSKEVTNAMNPTNTKKAVEKLFKVKA